MIQRRAAVALTAALISVPAVPVAISLLLSSNGADANTGPTAAAIATESGAEFVAETPDGWTVEQLPNRAVLRSGDAMVAIEAHDRDGREVGLLTDRLMRIDRVRGVSAALDGGFVATPDGALAGDTCVVTAEHLVGKCAVLASNDVVVYVQSLGTTKQPALPLSTVLEQLHRVHS